MDIQTGFLVGNILEGVYDTEVDAELCYEAIKKVYPDAKVNVDFQYAGGVIPYPLQTKIWTDDGELYDCGTDTPDDDIRTVEDICGEIYQEWKWVVEK